jgi:exopolyphosphatase/guanosine-5'-triphosphate,3'-diphosphate pyrophosphatase
MRLGIIDIGYNAIRAVVYEDNVIGAPEIFNHKFKNDILSLLMHEELDIKHQAYLSINYILHIFKKLQVSTIRCVATAVLRGQPRADVFIEFIKQKYNFTIEILSGEQEAYLTAVGLMSGVYDVDGIAADLGGGSLELIEIDNRVIGKLSSLALGTKIITNRKLQNLEDITKIIKEEYGDYQYKNLYLIGGALRFICRFFVEFNKYPLKNLHNLSIPREDLSSYLKSMKDLPSHRVKLYNKALNQNAILVAQAMLEVFRPDNIIVSIFGLKEGVRYEMLPEAEKNQDIVLQKVVYCCKYKLEETNFDKYYEIISPLLEESKDLYQILKLVIILQSLNKYFDQTLPPRAMNEYILNSEIPFTHRQRVMIVVALSYFSHFKPDVDLIKFAKKFLCAEDFKNSQIIGNFIRIAKDIDGFYFVEPSFSITNKNHYLEIVSKDILPRPIFEKVCDRLKSIAFIRKISSNK